MPKNKILGVKIEEYALLRKTKVLYLIPYKNDYAGLDSLLVDVAEDEKELRQLVKQHQQYGDDVRVIKIVKGGK
jgi:hypothetical protein